MSYQDSNGRQLLDSATMIKSGPRSGFCLITFRQTEECEDFAVKIAQNPCAMIRLLSLNVKGYREDMVINLLKGFDIATRGRALRYSWDAETWSPISDDDHMDPDFLDDLHNDGYILTEEMKEHQGPDKIVEVSRVVAESDMEMLKQLGVASDNVSLGTKDGVSILGDSSHATQGQSSVRSQNTQQHRRTLEEKYIAEAEAQEAEAAQRWKDIAFAATGATGLYSPTPNNLNRLATPRLPTALLLQRHLLQLTHKVLLHPVPNPATTLTTLSPTPESPPPQSKAA
jgi:hypothetical protein